MSKSFASKIIHFAFCVAALAVAWQAVRFWQGHVGAPGLDQLVSTLQDVFGPVEPADQAATPVRGFVELGNWANGLLYRLGGICVWLVLANLVASTGWTVARIVAVGFDQYQAEVREAERLAAAEDARFRRREARREARRAGNGGKPAAGFSLTALVIGIAIGKLF